jgi:ferric-dicitrate binding protein FerR (iron transport regulator)
MDSSNIDILISKKLNAELSEAEQKSLDAWLDESASNKAYFNSYLNLWAKLDPVHEEIDLEKKYNDFTTLREAKNQRVAFQYIAAAAAVLLVVFYFTLFSAKNSVQTNMQRVELALNDGSVVKLNRFSKIEYDFNDSERHVKLEGEALFKVQKDGRPFVIHTADAQIKVLGTEFTVSGKKSGTRVSVLEGRVLFRSIEDSSKSIILTHGMMSNSQDYLNNNANYQQSISWIDNRIEFNNVELAEIAERLETEFQISVSIKNDLLEGKKITATFADENPEDILKSLTELIGAELKIEDTNYIIL